MAVDDSATLKETLADTMEGRTPMRRSNARCIARKAVERAENPSLGTLIARST